MKKNFIKKEVALSKIHPKYKPILRDIKLELLNNFSDEIYSIYLYGSVATGKAKSRTSDLDLLVILKEKPPQKISVRLRKLNESFSKKYQKTFREVGIVIADKPDILQGVESFAWRFFITVLCVNIFGGSLYKKDKKFTITKKLAYSLNADIYSNLKKAKKEIKSQKTEKVNLKIQSIMKKIIRTAFTLVMAEENCWTTDLNEMTKIFTKYYPDKKKEINTVLGIAKSKAVSRKKAISIIDSFGKWVADELTSKTTLSRKA